MNDEPSLFSLSPSVALRLNSFLRRSLVSLTTSTTSAVELPRLRGRRTCERGLSKSLVNDVPSPRMTHESESDSLIVPLPAKAESWARATGTA